MIQQAGFLNNLFARLMQTPGGVSSDGQPTLSSFADLFQTAQNGIRKPPVTRRNLSLPVSGKNDVPLKGQQGVQTLRKFMLAAGIHPDQTLVGESAFEDLENILQQLGFDANQITGVSKRLLPEARAGELTLSALFDEIEELDVDPATDAPAFMEISAVPFVESILTGLGMEADAVHDVLGNAKVEKKGINLNRLVVGLKNALDSVHNRGRTPVPAASRQRIRGLMEQVGLAAGTGDDEPLTLEKLVCRLADRAAQPLETNTTNGQGIETAWRSFLAHLQPGEGRGQGPIEMTPPGVQANLNAEIGNYLASMGSRPVENAARFESTEIWRSFLIGAGFDSQKAPAVIQQPDRMPTGSNVGLSKMLAQVNAGVPEKSVHSVSHGNAVLSETVHTGINGTEAVEPGKVKAWEVPPALIVPVRGRAGTMVTGRSAFSAGPATQHHSFQLSNGQAQPVQDASAGLTNALIDDRRSKVETGVETTVTLRGNKSRNELFEVPGPQSITRPAASADTAMPAGAQRPSNPALPAYILNQVSRYIQKVYQNGKTRVTFQLTPPDMGRLKLRVDQTDQGVNVKIVAEKQAAGDMIASHTAELKTAFQEQGLRLERVDVTIQQDFRQAMADSGHGSRDQTGRRRPRTSADSDGKPTSGTPATGAVSGDRSSEGKIYLVA